jgi:predicted Rossmann fold flavoprotein
MMAAIEASKLGAKVALLEKNSGLGRKLLLTGKGRSNITRAEFNPKELAKKYGREGDFLLYPLSVFGVKETLKFFEEHGLKTKIERGKRIFPQSDKAGDVLNVLIQSLKKNNVSILTKAEVGEIFISSEAKEVLISGNEITELFLKDGRKITAKNYIICTGGKSYPQTGSTGDGYKWLQKLGHTIIKPRPALTPINIKEAWPKEAQGLSLKNVELFVFQNKKNLLKKVESRFGELLFTHFGISGPIVLDLSGKIGELLEKGGVSLFLDLKPALSFEKLDKRLQSDFAKQSNKMFKNSLADLLPSKLIPVIVKLSGINQMKKVNKITKEERNKLAKLLKNLEMTVNSLLGFETAIITLGGVSLKGIDAKTMKSKLIDNLFLAGEIINLHGPTGGYNLQLCWSTGHLAGQSSANSLPH